MMTNNPFHSKFMAGSKANIVNAFSVKENIGKTVELIQFVPPGTSAFYRDGYFDGHEGGCWIFKGEDLIRFTEGGNIPSPICAVDPLHLELNHVATLRMRTKTA